MGLFNIGEFHLHSGFTSPFKIDCNTLSDEELTVLAEITARKHHFSRVIGIPSGGLRFAQALREYESSGPVLIVDDILTTGKSMEMERNNLYKQGYATVGVVIFSRGPTPQWVTALFTMDKNLSKMLIYPTLQTINQ